MEQIADSRRILLIEDNADIADGVIDGLNQAGFFVCWAPCAARAKQLLEEGWDVIILDLMLPDMPGEALMHFISERPGYPPVLVLSAKASAPDKLCLFRQGCDDYLTKPFLFDELLARIKVLMRRPMGVREQTLKLNDLELIQESNTLKSPDGKVTLSPKETALLKLLLINAGKAVSRREILQSVWGVSREPTANYVGIHLFKLRKKLATVKREEWLKTIKYIGYSFSPSKSEAQA